ncbi:hypothetical protein [Ruminococcus sp.]|uniref:hypothetical protein n=1 Tax=Ruminococcus sp. TaxID=41978 RepID=UPI00258FA28B|nr:hypothetical protein [Ruminococcus sp.]MCR5021790.1 hypothetical protein [Ruminococcus sp.]
MKLFKVIRYNWIMVWLVVTAIILTSVVSYAAYTGTTTAKRVVSLSNRDSILFTSNYMKRVGTDIQPILVNYPEGTTPTASPVVIVEVRNYDSSGNVYDKNFQFKVKARLVHSNGTDITSDEWTAISSKPDNYKVAYKTYSANNLTDSYSNNKLTLTNIDQYLCNDVNEDIIFSCLGSDKTNYLFETFYDVNDIITTPTYGIRIEAEIVGSHGGDIDDIWGMMKVMKGGTSTKSTWEGKYMDDTSSPKKPADYDGINFQLSGNTKGKVKLTYRCDCVEIDKDDYKTLNLTDPVDTSVTNYKTLTIAVNAETTNMYDLRFYWIKAPDTSLAFNDNFIKAVFRSE